MRSSEDIKLDNTFWTNLNLLQNTLQVNEAAVAEEMGMHPSRFVFLRNNQLSIPFRNIHNFSRKMGINPAAFLEDQLCSNQIEKAFKKNISSQMPKQYRTGQGSKSFTVRHILKLANHYNLLEDVCVHFNLHKLSFESKLDFPVSVQLASDILEYISSKKKLTTSDFSTLGYLNSTYLKDSEFGKFLAPSHDVTELYERVVYVVNHLEQNWNYKIQFADKKEIILNSYPSDKMSDQYKRHDYSSFTFTQLRAQVGAHLTRYIGYEGVLASVTKSIHYGNNYCQFKFNIQNIKPISS